MTNNRQRRRRDERDPTPPRMVLTERDTNIIEAVYDCRVLRQDQLELFFFGSKPAAQRRLALLFHHGYLDREFLPVRTGFMTSPVLYRLGRKGEELLRRERGLEDARWGGNSRLSGEFLEHTLAINDFRLMVTKAADKQGLELLAWHSESRLKQDYDRVTVAGPRGSRSVSVIPDSYFALQTPRGRTHFFLELDRGTMPTKRFRGKVEAYLAYYRSGGYQRRYQAKSLRVLTVTLSRARLASLSTVTKQAGGTVWFWFGVLPELTYKNILTEPVWTVVGSADLAPLVIDEGLA